MENTLHSGHKRKKLNIGQIPMHVMLICGMSHENLFELVWINTFVDTKVCNFRDTDKEQTSKMLQNLLKKTG